MMNGRKRDRFKKENVIKELDRRAAALQERYKFDPDWGTAQLKMLGGSASEVCKDRAVEYGWYRCYQHLAQSLRDGELGCPWIELEPPV